MFRTTAAALITFVGISVVPAASADRDSSMTIAAPTTAISTGAPTAELVGNVEWSRPLAGPSRGAVLPALYVSFAMLQGYDAYSTLSAVRRGTAGEANPLMRGAAANSIAMWTVKGAATFTSIYFSERLWRQHHRAQAIGAMVASNLLVGIVAAHNASVVRAQR